MERLPELNVSSVPWSTPRGGVPDQLKFSIFCFAAEAYKACQNAALPSWPRLSLLVVHFMRMGRASPAHKRAVAIIFCRAKRPVSSWGALDWAVCDFSVELSQPSRKSVKAQNKNEQILFIALLLCISIQTWQRQPRMPTRAITRSSEKLFELAGGDSGPARL